MNQEMLERLSVITEEEREILNGRTEIDRTRYTKGDELVTSRQMEVRGAFHIDSGKMLEHGKLIRIRPHTRFVHFPKHKHNYIEVIYMCKGETTHVIDGETVVLRTGELLFLNQHATQEILPAGEGDVAVNFIILPEFFDTAFEMMGEEENLLRDFLVGCLCNDTRYASFLHFKVADVLPVQNLVENMVWTLLNDQPNKRSINQITMGLLFLQLMQHVHNSRVGMCLIVSMLYIVIIKYTAGLFVYIFRCSIRKGIPDQPGNTITYKTPYFLHSVHRISCRFHSRIHRVL